MNSTKIKSSKELKNGEIKTKNDQTTIYENIGKKIKKELNNIMIYTMQQTMKKIKLQQAGIMTQTERNVLKGRKQDTRKRKILLRLKEENDTL